MENSSPELLNIYSNDRNIGELPVRAEELEGIIKTHCVCERRFYAVTRKFKDSGLLRGKGHSAPIIVTTSLYLIGTRSMSFT